VVVRKAFGWFLLTSLAGAGAAHAEQCTFIGRTGAKVSPRSGRCNLDAQPVKDGHEICTYEDRTISDTNWRKGERQGPGWYVDYNNQKIEVRWKGEVVDGPVKVFDKTGALLCTMTVVNGKTEGVVRELWPGGHLKQATLFKNGEGTGPKIQLLDDGKVVDLTCDEKSFTPEDRRLCGHDGSVATVQFFHPDGKQRAYLARYRAGKLLEEETVDDKDQPMVRKHLDDRIEVTLRKHVDGLSPSRSRDLEEVDDLRHHHAGPRVVASRREVGEPGRKVVRRDAEKRAALRGMHRHRLEHHEADPAFRKSHVSCTNVVVDETVLAREPRHHRR